jgi:hypothetical protein
MKRRIKSSNEKLLRGIVVIEQEILKEREKESKAEKEPTAIS